MSRSALYASMVFVGIAASFGCGDDGSSAALAAPSQLKVEALEGGAHVTWKDNSENESSFMIERKSGGSSWNSIATVPFDTTQYHDAMVVAGTAYVYRVMAMPKTGGHEEGAYSDEVKFTAPADATGSEAAGSSGAHTGHTAGGAGS